MAIVDRHIDPAGLGNSVLNFVDHYVASHRVGGSGNVLTTNSLATSANVTVAVGTNLDFPRNLSYVISITGGSASATGISLGTLNINGLDPWGRAISESVGLQALAAAGTNGSIGGAIFGSINSNGISFASYSLATAWSGNSNSATIAIGAGNIVGIINPVRSTNAVPYAWIGTTPQVASYTVVTGPVGNCGVSFSNALATNTPVAFVRFQTR